MARIGSRAPARGVGLFLHPHRTRGKAGPETRWKMEPFLDKVTVSNSEALAAAAGETAEEHARLEKEAAEIRKRKPNYEKAAGVVDGEPVPMRLFHQSDITEPKEVVPPGPRKWSGTPFSAGWTASTGYMGRAVG